MITGLVTVIVAILAIYFFGNKMLEHLNKKAFEKLTALELEKEVREAESQAKETVQTVQKVAEVKTEKLKEELSSLEKVTAQKPKQQTTQSNKRPNAKRKPTPPKHS